ncbi:GNAT family N-acetyltransferase [Pontibacter sp. JH31]|uniref:GNAT family N-acetyltransferase n=1 Tax=Pontibacter aquaedesilientis TaxID=2766980 RepID=A0ABR7XMV9_9BACT|nr:GNAT family N-acetyltransferase [Pontibacter aquaedesilientis]MBD1398983.1 GNAT family N-acetyltransferase [Pontibacter aquaedesilientis]
MVEVVRYSGRYKSEWDAFVRASKNGTFILLRDYMAYHADRFEDYSLLFYRNEELVAVLPANVAEGALHAHAGLSYSGVLCGSGMKAVLMLQVFDALIAYCRTQGFHALYYKAIPHIYHQLPAEEDLYALFRSGAVLHQRTLNSVITPENKLPYTQLRKRKIKRAARYGLQVRQSQDYQVYMQLVAQVLKEKYKLEPTHTADELARLATVFPENINLFAVFEGETMVAGMVMYESATVAHSQYIASTARGREIAALDFLTDFLLTQVYPHKKYFSFGVSTEQQGLYLNEGLVNNKESYGARTVVHDFYRLEF